MLSRVTRRTASMLARLDAIRTTLGEATQPSHLEDAEKELADIAVQAAAERNRAEQRAAALMRAECLLHLGRPADALRPAGVAVAASRRAFGRDWTPGGGAEVRSLPHPVWRTFSY